MIRLKMVYFSDQFNQKGSISSPNVENSSILSDFGLVHPSQHSSHAFLAKPADRNYLFIFIFVFIIIVIILNEMGGEDFEQFMKKKN